MAQKITMRHKNAQGAYDTMYPKTSLDQIVGGLGGVASITVTYPAGSTVSMTNGTTTLNAPDTSGTWTAYPDAYGDWIINANLDGETAQQAVTIDTIKDYPITVRYWEWGDETAIGDARWWAGLRSWVLGASADELQAVVGKTKGVLLSSAVLGNTSLSMRCIGANQDGAQTLTFHAAGYCLETSTVFGDSAVWIGSTVRQYCQDFYNACSAKASIKTVSKGTCDGYGTGSTMVATYNDETVWLPSELEMGWLNTYGPSINSATNSECTYGYSAGYSYYDVSTLATKQARCKKGTQATSTLSYWLRSRTRQGSYTNGVIDPNGASGYMTTGSKGYIAPAFVIG